MFITKKGLARIIDEAVMEEIERREHTRYINGQFEELHLRINDLASVLCEIRCKLETDAKK